MVAEIDRILSRWTVICDLQVVTGGCRGVDAQVARSARKHGLFVYTVLPANRSQVDPDWWAYADAYKEMPKGSSYRDRDKALVDLSNRLVALPRHPEHDPRSKRSGTWLTVRLAREAGKPVDIVTWEVNHAEDQV